MDLTFTALERFCAKFGGNWTTNKGETEGGTILSPVPAEGLAALPSADTGSYLFKPGRTTCKMVPTALLEHKLSE